MNAKAITRPVPQSTYPVISQIARRSNAMRAKFTYDSLSDTVALAYDVEDYEGVDRRVTRYFSCPSDGGYIYEYFGHGGRRQVCEKLSSRGSTLIARDPKDLLRIIRREYRAMRRVERLYA